MESSEVYIRMGADPLHRGHIGAGPVALVSLSFVMSTICMEARGLLRHT